MSIRVSACVNGTRFVWIVCWFDDDEIKYRSAWWSDNWPIIPVFDDDDGNVKSLLFDKNDDVDIPVFIVDRFGNVLLLSSDECPSNEPFVNNDVGGFVERSFSDIVRDNKGDCWELIVGSSEVGGDNSRGMFDVDIVDPGPVYNDDGIVVPLANVNVDDVFDDDPLICEILLRICWFNIPERSLFVNNDGGWELFVVTDDNGWVDDVVGNTVESLLFIDVCLEICFVEGEWIFACLDVELLLDVVAAVVVVDVDVDGKVFWETIVEYCRTGWVDDDDDVVG